MSRYIDADAFIDDLYEHEFSNWCDKDEVSTLVDDAPSIDRVFCKECTERDDDWCLYWQNVVNPEDFCSYGERKESERWKITTL